MKSFNYCILFALVHDTNFSIDISIHINNYNVLMYVMTLITTPIDHINNTKNPSKHEIIILLN